MDTSTLRITNEIPEDKQLLEAMGRVAIRHAQLDAMLKYVLKTLSGQSVGVIFKNHPWHTGRLQRKVRDVAGRKLSGKPLEMLVALLDRCEEATDARNDLVHSFWQAVADSDPKEYRMLRSDGVTISALPTVAEVNAASRMLLGLANELNHERLEGFLAKAISPQE